MFAKRRQNKEQNLDWKCKQRDVAVVQPSPLSLLSWQHVLTSLLALACLLPCQLLCHGIGLGLPQPGVYITKDVRYRIKWGLFRRQPRHLDQQLGCGSMGEGWNYRDRYEIELGKYNSSTVGLSQSFIGRWPPKLSRILCPATQSVAVLPALVA